MSIKKQLLTESEVRRFMRLANIPALTENFSDITEMEGIGEAGQGDYQMQQEESPMEPEQMGDEPAMDEPEMDSDMGGAGGSEKESKFAEAIKILADIANVKVDFGDEGESEEQNLGDLEDDSEDEVDLDSDSEGEEGEESDEAGEAGEGEGEEEEMDESELHLQEELVQKILSRVTARLVAEAKSKDKDKKKKGGKQSGKELAARLKKAKSDKAKKLEEANAPAPKSTSSNGPKKGAGSATKGNWGVNEKVAGHEWKNGTSNRGDKMQDVTPSADHVKTHGKKNLSTLGGNKTK